MIPFGKSQLAFGVATAAGLVLAVSVFGQGAKPANAPPTTAHPTAKTLDSHFAACLIWQNENEVAAAKLGERKSSSQEVRDFAQMLAKDHERSIKDLEQFAGSTRQIRRSDAAGAPGRPGATALGDNARPVAANAPAGDPMEQMLQIKAEIADACRASTEKELSSKSGAEFDQCFMGMQVGKHMYLVDELKVLERHASPELQQVLRQERQTTEKHLERGKAIIKNLDRAQTAEKGKSTTSK